MQSLKLHHQPQRRQHIPTPRINLLSQKPLLLNRRIRIRDNAAANRFHIIIQRSIEDDDRLADGVLICLLYTSPSPRDATLSRMPSSA